jgi:D-arabinose 1-dehydrogenase-like Zn-dependent alcohol dehydrogenase
MKAAILQEIDAPLKVVDANLPELTFGQVLVRVSCARVFAGPNSKK